MHNPPYQYSYINSNYAETPQAFLRIHNTGASRFFRKYLMQDALSVFKWKLPENWDPDFFRYVLMGFGFVAVFKTDLFGVIPQNCTLSGYNVFYRPTKALVSNPLIGSVELDIGRNCELIKLMPDYSSVSDLIDYYSDLMALTYESLAVNILNSRLAYLIGVDGKADADTFKLVFDQILSGAPAVVYRKKAPGTTLVKGAATADPWQTVLQNLKNTFISPELIDSLNGIRDEFLTAIGVPNLSERKKERVNTIDSQRNTVETQTKVDLWLEELKAGVERVKAMFPEVNILSVEKRYKPDAIQPEENGELTEGSENM